MKLRKNQIKMRTTQIYLIFILFRNIATLHKLTQGFSKFPLSNCTTGNINLLVITDTLPQADCIDQKDFIDFFSSIRNMFLQPGQEIREHLHMTFVTYSLLRSQPILRYTSSISSTEMKIMLPQFTNCSTNTNYQQTKEVTILPIFDFVYMHFNGLESNENTSNVAIMVLTGPNPGAVNDVDRVQNYTFQETNIKLFVIMVGFVEEVDQIATIPDTLSVPRYSDLASHQLILMSVCKQCRPGWFLFDHKDSQFSCYFLDIHKGMLKDWFEESLQCAKFSSELVSIETEDELHFLETKVYEEMKNSDNFNDNLNIFIGLRGNYKNTYKGFRWLSGNPMIITHWADKSIYEEDVKKCGLWMFEVPGTNATMSNQSQFSENMTYTNGWKDFSCGATVSVGSFCEIVHETFRSGGNTVLEIAQASASSIDSAITKGEFLSFQGKVISIPANSETLLLDSTLGELNSGFELFHCEDDEGKGKSISYSYVCDHVTHCNNSQDEMICLYRDCDPSLEFKCSSRQCVPEVSRCDVYSDCYDNSDENDCMDCKQKRCCEGTCVPKHWFNDNDTYCNTCSDEELLHEDQNLRATNEESCVFICNRSSCVSLSQLGDGIVQCTGPEGHLDETLGKLKSVDSCYDKNGKVKWAPRCVYVRDRYGGILGCRDMSHLSECQNFLCPEGYTKCPGSYCIALHLVLDGKKDCPLGEDEQGFNDHTCTGNFACSNSHVCLHPDLVCDGAPQCPSRDDELNCNVTCSSGFQCISGTVSVKGYDLTIPLKSLAFVDRSTRYLDLSGIEVSGAIIGQDVTHLKSLITIRLSYCKITTVNDFFARGVSNLKTVYSLDLSNNLLRKIPKNSMFRFMLNLRNLNLSYNENLAVLEENAFLAYYGESLLEKLYLQNTAITVLQSSVLQGLQNLKILNLSNTLIVNLFKDSFPKDFRLHILDLRDTYILGYDTNSFNGLWIKNSLFTDSFGLCCPQIRGDRISDRACHSPRDTISSCSHLVREIVQRVLLWIVGFVAVLGNVTVILCRIMWDKNVIRNAYGIFVTCLGISDLIMGLYLLIIACTDFYFRDNYVLNGKVWKESTICQIAGFMSTLSSETSAFFTLLVTLDRYLVMKFPFGQYNFSKKGMFLATVLVWITGFVLAVIPTLPSSKKWAVFSSNSMCLGLPLDTNKLAGAKYSIGVFVALNSIIFLIIVVGQFSIYRAMSENRITTTAVHNSNRHAQDTAVARQLSLVVLSNFLCWFPIGVMGLLALTGHEIGKNAYTWAAVLVLPINSAINPLLYTVPVIHDRWKLFRSANSKLQTKGCKEKTIKEVEIPKLQKNDILKKDKN